MLTSFVALVLAAILIITSMAAFPIASASTIPQQQLIPSLVEYSNNYYQNAMDGFRVQIPKGWVIYDLDNTGLAALGLAEQLGYELLAVLCPQDQALPAIGGTYRCPIESNPSTTFVSLFRYSNLYDRREFVPILEQNKTINISDLFAFHIQRTEEGGVTNIQIQKTGLKNNNMTTINVIDPTTNQTVETAPIMVAEFSYGPPELASSYLPSKRDLVQLALSNDTNTGFVVDPILQQENETLSTLPPPVKQILDSFELVILPKIFQSNEDGFRVQVPNGWVVEDINSTANQVQQLSASPYGFESLANLCPRDQAVHVIDGEHTCPFPLPLPTSVAVELYRFNDLPIKLQMAEHADPNKTITTSDLLAFFIYSQQKLKDPNALANFAIVNDTDITVNVTDSKTNQIVGSVPAKYIEWTHTYGSGTEIYKEFALLVLSNDTNTGYVVRPQILQESSRETPTFVRQVLDSLELVK
jgi:hypothetical protein